MLPHNRLGRALYRHLKVYAGPDHPHEAQVRGSEKRRQAPADAGSAAQTETPTVEQAPAPSPEENPPLAEEEQASET
jgi:hypothetical protein